MPERTLFPMGPIDSEDGARRLARRTDPETSKEAAKLLDITQAELWALGVVRRRGPGTALEMSRADGYQSQHRLARRLKALADKKFIDRLPPRLCRVSGNGRRAIVWRAR